LGLCIVGDNQGLHARTSLNDVTRDLTVVKGNFMRNGKRFAIALLDAVGYEGTIKDDLNLSGALARSSRETTKLHKIFAVVSASRFNAIDVRVAEMLEINLSDRAKLLVHFIITKCPPKDEDRLKQELIERVTQFGDIRNRITCVDLIDRDRFEGHAASTEQVMREWYGTRDKLREIITEAEEYVHISDAFNDLSLKKLKRNYGPLFLYTALLFFFIVIASIIFYKQGRVESQIEFDAKFSNVTAAYEEEIRRIIENRTWWQTQLSKIPFFGRNDRFVEGITTRLGNRYSYT
jgi:hypothetical protein